jgi:hypothetical protein
MSSPDYGVVLVVDVAGEVLAVGPPALLAEAASAMPPPASARTLMIIVVFRSQVWAWRTPAGLPGAKAVESANAFVAQSASDIAKQTALFISIPLEGRNKRNARPKERFPQTQPAYVMLRRAHRGFCHTQGQSQSVTIPG